MDWHAVAATKSLNLLRLQSVPDHEAVDRLENRLRTLACSRRGHDLPPQYRHENFNLAGHVTLLRQMVSSKVRGVLNFSILPHIFTCLGGR